MNVQSKQRNTALSHAGDSFNIICAYEKKYTFSCILPPNYLIIRSIAEREGFEPPKPFSSPVFKTGAIDHSAISP